MTAPARAQTSATFDPLGPEYLSDPYPTLDQVRTEAPAFYAPSIDMWVVTRFADVEAAFMDPATFSARIAQDPLSPLTGETKAILAQGFNPLRTMSNAEPDIHVRIRAHAQKGFSNRRIALMETVIREPAGDMIDALAAGGSPADLVASLSYPLPATTIFRFIGFDDADTEMLKAWCLNRLPFSWGRPEPALQAEIARNMVAYWRYCQDFVRRRMAEPADDFTSDLLAVHLEDPDSLSVEEIMSIVYGLSFAGHETTTNLIGNTVRRLLEDPDQWAAIVADRALIPGAVEEGLRHDSSVITWRRITTRPVSIDGVDVPEGARLLLLLASANHDPARFEAPDRFDLHRPNARGHISLGKGIHYCLGAALARLEVRVVLEELTRRLPGLALVPGQDLSFPANVAFRGPERLLVTW